MIEFELLERELEAFINPFADIKTALHPEKSQLRIEELELRSAQPEFWDDPENAQKVQKELVALKKKLAKLKSLEDKFEDLHVMLDLGKEEVAPEILQEFEAQFALWQKELEILKLETYFTDELDGRSAVVTLHAGAGGTEACDWAAMLFRMYSRWGEEHEFDLEVLDSTDGDEAGYKSISFKLNGENAYGLLKNEMGVHRLVRISPFDSSGRRHTSFASVEVMPELDKDINIEIKPDDLKVDYYRASGAGGQHVNKTSSAVRLTHLPTGLVAACQNERSQIQNKEYAMQMLKAKLYTLARQAQLEKVEDLKGEQLNNAFGSQIRSYVFCPYTLVKDNRTGVETPDIDGVMEGDIDAFIAASLALDTLEKRERPCE